MKSASAKPFAGPLIVREHYDEIPFASMAWAVLRIPAEKTAVSALPSPLPDLPAGTLLVVSARYALGAVQMRAEAITADAGTATRLTETVNAFVAIFKAMTQPAAQGQDGGTAPTGDADVRALAAEIWGDMDGVSRTIRFPELPALVRFQSNMDTFLLRTGWLLLNYAPDRRRRERRNRGERRPDRRRRASSLCASSLEPAVACILAVAGRVGRSLPLAGGLARPARDRLAARWPLAG